VFIPATSLAIIGLDEILAPGNRHNPGGTASMTLDPVL